MFTKPSLQANSFIRSKSASEDKSPPSKRSPENMQKLKNLIQHDILEAVQRNVTAGNLTVSEGQTLKRVALQIYNHIYNKYDELER